MTAADLDDEFLDLDQLPDSDLDPDPTVSYERTRREAEGLLRLAAEIVELKHGADLAAIPDSRLLAMATVGAGLATLAAIDLSRQQTNRQASLAGQVLAEFRAIVAVHEPEADPAAPADFLIDSTDDQWTHTGNGLYESKQDPGLFDVPVDQIRAQWGPVREFVLRPPRPAG